MFAQKSQHNQSHHRDYSAFLAGYFGGITSVLIGYPFDTIKVRVQVQNGKNHLYNGPFDCIKKTIKKEGFFAFYQGVWFPLLSVGITRSINMGIAESTGALMSKYKILEGQDKLKYFLCGGLGGSAISLITTPIDNLRTKMQVQTYSTSGASAGSFRLATNLVSQHGFSSLYRALSVTSTRNFIGCGSFYSTYQYLKKYILTANHEKKLTCMEQCLCGAISGMAFWVFTFPLDSVKSKIQADSPRNPKYRGTIDCLYKTMAAKGPKSLFNGLTPTLIKSIPMNVGFWAVYESTLSLSRKYGNSY